MQVSPQHHAPALGPNAKPESRAEAPTTPARLPCQPPPQTAAAGPCDGGGAASAPTWQQLLLAEHPASVVQGGERLRERDAAQRLARAEADVEAAEWEVARLRGALERIATQW
jgi:hypothetical protein